MQLCLWEIIPKDPTAQIRFYWSDGDIQLEDEHDTLTISDGLDYFSVELAELTGAAANNV